MNSLMKLLVWVSAIVVVCARIAFLMSVRNVESLVDVRNVWKCFEWV